MLAPSLGIHVDHPKVRFDLDGTYELRKYFDPDLAERLDRFTDFNTRMKLDVLPRGVVGFRIVDNAVLRNRTSDNPFRPSSLLTQLRNDLSGYVTARPGPDLDIEAGAGWAWHNYQVPGADARSSMSPASNRPGNWSLKPSSSSVASTFSSTLRRLTRSLTRPPPKKESPPAPSKITPSEIGKPHSTSI